MMTLKRAILVRNNDIVYDITGKQLKVKEYSITFADGRFKDVHFRCIDNSDPTIESYHRYDELYEHFEDLSDEEKHFITWIKTKHYDTNLEFKYLDNDEISKIKSAYLSGFAEGFAYRQKISAEEQLQK